MLTLADLSLIMSYVRSGQLDAADRLLRPILSANPESPQALYLSGMIAERQGQVDEAIRRYRQVTSLAPGFSHVRKDLGNALLKIGRVEAAIGCLQQALAMLPGFDSARLLLAEAYRQHGEHDEAIEHYREVLLRRPDHVDALAGLAEAIKACREHRRSTEALKCIELALAIRPREARFWLIKAQLHQFGSDYHEADRCCRHAITLEPNLFGARFLQATLDFEQGDLEQSAENLHSLIEHARQAPSIASKLQHKIIISAYSQIANVLRRKTPDEAVAAIQRLMGDPRSENLHKTVLSVALAQFHDSRKEYRESCRLLTRVDGKPRVDDAAPLDPYVEHEHVAQLILQWNPTRHRKLQRFGVPSERPVFIIGLPRSGTTLTEQILASHPQIHGAGELFLIAREFQRLPRRLRLNASPAECIAHLDASHMSALAEDVLAELYAIDPSAERVIDKLPDNYHHVGLISALFPRARIIHCQRDVRDVAVSLFLNNFESLHWTNDVGHIAERIRDYWTIMHHWRRTPTVNMLEIDYEDLVSDVETHARRLVDWVGLEWNDACLRHTECARPITTCSFGQARSPVHTGSIGKWRHYEELLRPLLKALDPGYSDCDAA